MKNVFDFLSVLQNSYKEYYELFKDDPFNIQKFSLWLFNEGMKSKKEESHFSLHENANDHADSHLDDHISFILLSLHRLIKFYVKKGTEGTNLVSVEDIHFLLYLSENASMKKSEIINSAITEMSSGIEVIKRLIKKGLIEDFDDPDDKRSKRVRITPKGLEEINSVRNRFSKVHELIAAPLDGEDKFLLLGLITKLYDFHLNIFNNEKDTPLNELIDKYLPHG